ncbi:MAG TPA: Calx-beta domain-containing protein [Acidimicrobiales bacterium]|nr:Calx-beta domain-containing protein [Acidimicrobiales bacterium]
MRRWWSTLSRRNKLVTGVVLAVLVVAGVVASTQSGGATSTKNQEVIILNTVQRRTLQSTLALTGTLARKQIRNITAATEGLVSAVFSTNGSTTQADQPMFALNGRNAIAETGTVPFFRSLGLGDEGSDVMQLKQILLAAGDDPGPMTPIFTEQTQFALAQWQDQHGYPSATPATAQSVTVALQEGTGYTLGDDVSAGLIIGPPAAQTAASRSAASRSTPSTDATLTADQSEDDPLVTPVLTIQSEDDDVSQGMPATFVISASPAPTSDITVNLSSGGTAGAQDIVTPPTSVVLSSGDTSATVTVQTRVNTVVEPDPTVVMSIAPDPSVYSLGSPSSAQTTIEDDNVPALQISGGTTIPPGGATTLTITANQAPVQNTQVALTLSGSAVAGTDYDPVDPVVTLDAGSTSASLTIDTLDDTVIQPNKYIVASIAPSSSYSVGSQGSTVVTISGSNALPTVTLSSATTYLQKGQPYEVTISLSQALGTPLTIDLTYGGNATEGTDYTVPGGLVTVPAGQTSLQLSVPTVTNNVVESDRTLTVTLAASPAYKVGTQSSVSVTMKSSVVPELTISAGTATVAQGGSASFVITANQPVVENTSVNFTVEGTAQPGQNYEPVVGAALLKAGQTRVTVVLQTLRTDVTFEPTDMIVGTWPTRVGQVFVKAGAPATPGEAILSLTEPDLTVTLQASAANRTMLKVGQSCTVQISGATTSAPGTITELDSTPTNISSSAPGGGSSQVYEGKIEVPDLNGADGSSVSITVVDQQVEDALTVPIAAVEQDGVGKDAVRVFDRQSDNTTTVPVRTGLTEGSYIQITNGLHEGQTVIVQVNQPQ